VTSGLLSWRVCDKVEAGGAKSKPRGEFRRAKDMSAGNAGRMKKALMNYPLSMDNG
jgi:hypothetical protein